MMLRRGLVLLSQANTILVALAAGATATATVSARVPAAAFVPHRPPQCCAARSAPSASATAGARDADRPEGGVPDAVHAPKRKGRKPRFTLNPVGTATTRSDGNLADKKRDREARRDAAPAVASNLGVTMPQLDTRGGRDGNGRARRPNRQQNGSVNNHRRGRTPPPPMPPPGQAGGACFRERIAVGAAVLVVQKGDQRTGRETEGTVQQLLTGSAYHPRGIKVRLASGVVGRVTRFAGERRGGEAAAAPEGGAEPGAPPPVPPSPPRSVSPGGGSSTGQAAPLFVVDEGALAMLVGEMDFDERRVREALEIYDNDVERAVHRLLQQE